MNKDFKKRIVHFIAPTVFLTIILSLMCFLRYIDVTVILTIYIPIWIIGVITSLLGKVVFADIIIIFAGVGLIAEYLIHISNESNPNMSGAFLNTLILLFGLILGIVLQILSSKKLKVNDSK